MTENFNLALLSLQVIQEYLYWNKEHKHELSKKIKTTCQKGLKMSIVTGQSRTISKNQQRKEKIEVLKSSSYFHLKFLKRYT